MNGNAHDSAIDIFDDSSGDLAKLRAMMITNSAIRAYLKRIREGKDKEEALRALLRGRHLSSQQVRFVREAMERLLAHTKPSSEAGFLRLGPGFIRAANRCCDADTLFFAGLLLLVSPILILSVLQPPFVLILILAGLLCSASALTVFAFSR